jgi:hypothetical protein
VSTKNLKGEEPLTTKAKAPTMFHAPVSKAKLLQEEGKWIPNPNKNSDLAKIFSATYTILWRSYNPMPPYSDEDICEIIQVGNFE